MISTRGNYVGIMLEQHVTFFYFFQSILGIVIFHSTFLKVENQEDSFCFSYIPRSHDLLPTPPPAQNCVKRESQKRVDCFGLWEGLPLHSEVMENSFTAKWKTALETDITKAGSGQGTYTAAEWKKMIRLYQEIVFMNKDIKLLNIEWRTSYPLTNFQDRLGLRASVIFLDSNMCGFLFICTLASSQTLVVNWQNLLFISFH